MYRKTCAYIDGIKLEKNAKEIVTKYNDYKYYIGVVKNNAYGHGIKVVTDLIRGGINYLAVSSLEEAIAIRKYTTEIPVLVLEPISLEYIDDAMMNKVTLTIESLEYLKELDAMKLPYQIPIHLKIDSGMNRLGFKSKREINAAIKIINENKKIYLEGIYSHFATSGMNDFYYDKQLETFEQLISDIDLSKVPIIHLDRSLTFVHHKKISYVNGVRLGICLYGFNGSRKPRTGLKGLLQKIKRDRFIKKYHISETILENDLKLHTAFSLYTEVFSLRKVSKGEAVGYEANYKVEEDGFIATLPIGYADGVTKEFAYVVIRGKKYKIVADSMDMIMVLVDKSVKIKDKVEIFGNTISIPEVTNRLGINAYHLFNQITTRVVRVHKEENDEIEIKY